MTSARAASPQAPAWALQGVGRAPFNQTSCSYCQFVSFLFSPPSSSQPPPLPHPRAGSLVLSFLRPNPHPTPCSLLSSAREIFGGNLSIQEKDLGFLLYL